jgi:hypothetical protein
MAASGKRLRNGEHGIGQSILFGCGKGYRSCNVRVGTREKGAAVTTSASLRAIANNMWVVDGTIQMPPGPLPRRMAIARLTSGDLVVFSAIALDDAVMAEVEALGRPTFLVVPNAFHREDAPEWKRRYPDIRVVAPERARAAVDEVVKVDDTVGDFGDSTVRFVPVPGTKGESAMIVRHQSSATLVVNDLIANVQNSRGIMKVVLTLMGFAGSSPQVPRMFKKRAVEDAVLVARQFRDWAATPGLSRIVVSHGSIIEQAPPLLLERLADKLSPQR